MNIEDVRLFVSGQVQDLVTQIKQVRDEYVVGAGDLDERLAQLQS